MLDTFHQAPYSVFAALAPYRAPSTEFALWSRDGGRPAGQEAKEQEQIQAGSTISSAAGHRRVTKRTIRYGQSNMDWDVQMMLHWSLAADGRHVLAAKAAMRI